jgi:hypothetical protein
VLEQIGGGLLGLVGSYFCHPPLNPLCGFRFPILPVFVLFYEYLALNFQKAADHYDCAEAEVARWYEARWNLVSD